MSRYRGGRTPDCALVRLLEALLLALLGQMPQLWFREPPQKCFSWFVLHAVLAFLIAWSSSSRFLLFASLQWSCLMPELRNVIFSWWISCSSGSCSSHRRPDKWDFLNISYLLLWGVEDFHVFEDSLSFEESHRLMRTLGVDLIESYLKAGIKLLMCEFVPHGAFLRKGWGLMRAEKTPAVVTWVVTSFYGILYITRFHFSCVDFDVIASLGFDIHWCI